MNEGLTRAILGPHPARNGRVRYELKTPWRNGTTHVIFEPLDFISRLVSLVPRPRVNLTRFHGVFAPKSKYRSKVTPAGRGKLRKRHPASDVDQTPAEKRASMTWAIRLKRVFNLDVETCDKCGGDIRIIWGEPSGTIIELCCGTSFTDCSCGRRAQYDSAWTGQVYLQIR